MEDKDIEDTFNSMTKAEREEFIKKANELLIKVDNFLEKISTE